MTFWEGIVAIVIAFAGGAGFTAFVNGRTERWKFKAQREAAKEDKAEEKADRTSQLKAAVEKFEETEDKKNREMDKRLSRLEKQNAAQTEALKLIMLDRILHLGQGFIERGSISYDDRKRLHDMHKCYHDGLGGNGDANLIMEAVDDLQLSK